MAKKIKAYTKTELIKIFGLNSLVGNNEHPLLQEWTNCTTDFMLEIPYFHFQVILETRLLD